MASTDNDTHTLNDDVIKTIKGSEYNDSLSKPSSMTANPDNKPETSHEMKEQNNKSKEIDSSAKETEESVRLVNPYLLLDYDGPDRQGIVVFICTLLYLAFAFAVYLSTSSIERHVSLSLEDLGSSLSKSVLQTQTELLHVPIVISLVTALTPSSNISNASSFTDNVWREAEKEVSRVEEEWTLKFNYNQLPFRFSPVFRTRSLDSLSLSPSTHVDLIDQLSRLSLKHSEHSDHSNDSERNPSKSGVEGVGKDRDDKDGVEDWVYYTFDRHSQSFQVSPSPSPHTLRDGIHLVILAHSNLPLLDPISSHSSHSNWMAGPNALVMLSNTSSNQLTSPLNISFVFQHYLEPVLEAEPPSLPPSTSLSLILSLVHTPSPQVSVDLAPTGLSSLLASFRQAIAPLHDYYSLSHTHHLHYDLPAAYYSLNSTDRLDIDELALTARHIVETQLKADPLDTSPTAHLLVLPLSSPHTLLLPPHTAVTTTLPSRALPPLLAQLRLLLGLPPPLSPHSHSPIKIYTAVATEWELTLWSRVRGLSLTQHAKEFLVSFVTLVNEQTHVPVPAAVAADITTAVQLLNPTSSFPSSSHSRPLTLHERVSRAHSLSSRALVHPDMLGSLFIPLEHLWAIYAPMFAPVVAPALIAIIKMIKAFKSRSKSSTKSI